MPDGSITIRTATEADRPAIARLAALDGRPQPVGDALLAFVGDDLAVARPVAGGIPVADPFKRTRALEELLEVAARGARAA